MKLYQLLSLFFLGLFAGTIIAPVDAQERAAGGSLDIQTNWASLKTKVDQATLNSQAATSLAEAIKTCGTKGMIYAPGTAGIDGQGCKAVATAMTHRNCAWRELPVGQYNVICPSPQVMTGLYFEGATWSGSRDNHAGPEVPYVMCCDL